MGWEAWLILIAIIVGIFTIISIVFKLIGFGIKIICKFTFYTIIGMILCFLLIIFLDTCFDTGIWNIITAWFNNINI
ncbi:MAG: hypothetical protein HRS50_00755 [Mycoplasmataceae bacterium]|nr:hypothetical protein [Mycoplasmataceae bacterium]